MQGWIRWNAGGARRCALGSALGCALIACDGRGIAVAPRVGDCVFEGCGDADAAGAGEPPVTCSWGWTSTADFAQGSGAGLDDAAVDGLRGAPGLEAGRWTSPVLPSCGDSPAHLLAARAEGVTPKDAARRLWVRSAEDPQGLAQAPWRPVDTETGLAASAGGARLFQVQVVLTPNPAGEPTTVHRVEVCLGAGAGLLRVDVRDAVTGRGLPRAVVEGGPCGPSPVGRDAAAYVPVLPGAGDLRVRADLRETSILPPIAVRAGVVQGQAAPLVATGLWPHPRGGHLNRGVSPVCAHMVTPPGVRWRRTLPGGNFPRQVMLVDLDGNTAAEILAVVDEHLEARRGDGTLLWRSHGGAGDEIGAIVGVADLDGDGQVEVVGGNYPADGTAGRFRLGRLTVLAGKSGAVRYSDSLFDVHGGFGTASHIRPGYAQILEADGDPALEILVSAEYSHEVRLYDFSAGIEQGEVRWTAGWSGYKNYRRLAAGDVDGDGFAEAIVGATGRLAILNGRDGSARYTPSMGDETIQGSIFLRDIVGDARPEILYLGYTPERLEAYVRGDDGEFTTLYSVELPAIPLAASELVAEVDGDALPEIVFQIGDFTQVRDAATGALESAIPGALRGLADLDGDGAAEIVIDPSGVGLELHGAAPPGAGGGVVRKSSAAGVGFSNVRNPWYGKYTRAPANVVRPDPGVMRDTPVHEESLGAGLLWTRSRATNALVALETEGATLRERWRLPIAPESTFGVVGVADLDGDGTEEGVVALGDGRLQVVDATGQPRADFPLTRRVATPLVVPLNGTDDRAILVAGRDTASGRAGVGPLEALRVQGTELVASRVGDGVLYFAPGAEPRAARVGSGDALLVRSGPRTASVWGLDGTPRWTTPPFADDIQHLGTGDFAGDGHPQVLVRLESGASFALDGDTGAPLWSRADRNGFIPAVLDLDADGRDDLAYSDSGERVHGTRGADGATLFDTQYKPLSANGLMMAGDLDGDGDDELITSGNYCSMAFARDATVHFTGIGAESNKDHPGALVEAGADGTEDVVQPTNHGVYRYDGRTGAVRWVHRRPTDVAFTGAVVADLDGDGASDVLVGAGDGSLALLDADTGEPKWRVDLGARPGDPVVADVDGDGDAEILVAAGGELLILDEGVGPLLTLDPAGPDASDAFPVAGDAVGFEQLVRNPGGVDVEGARATLRVDGRDVATVPVDVAAGGAAGLRFDWVAEPGEHRVDVHVDGASAGRTLRVR